MSSAGKHEQSRAITHWAKLLAVKPKGPKFNSWNPHDEREEPSLESYCLASVRNPKDTNTQINVTRRSIKGN